MNGRRAVEGIIRAKRAEAGAGAETLVEELVLMAGRAAGWPWHLKCPPLLGTAALLPLPVSNSIPTERLEETMVFSSSAWHGEL